jgi:hypothetical protein
VQEQVDHMRIKYGFWIILMGFFRIALITAASILKWNDVTSVATVIGATTSLVGTVVGSFLGVQVGAAGKERVEADRKQSEETARIALSMLPPEVAIQVQEDVGSRGRPTS